MSQEHRGHKHKNTLSAHPLHEKVTPARTYGAQKRAPEGRYASQVSGAHCWGLQMSLMALNYM